MRRRLSALACAAALLSPLPAGIAITATAQAQSPINVVGMSQADGQAALSAAGVPYIILNRSGSTMQDCRVTEQRDRGYYVEVDYDYDDGEWKKTETDVWRGLALVVVCN